MSNAAISFAHESGDDAENVDDVEQIPRRTRGCGLIWRVIAVHPTLIAAFDSLLSEGQEPRLKGRVNRGTTCTYHYFCAKKSCGCEKQWKFCTSKTTSEVTEEETAGDHSHHDDLQRNGGRELSFEQVQIVDELHALRVKKPLLIIEGFNMRAKELHEAGAFPILN